MKGFVLCEDVPDRLRQLPGEVDARHLGSALTTEAQLHALVSLHVAGIAGSVCGRLDERPTQVGGPVLRERAAPVLAA